MNRENNKYSGIYSIFCDKNNMRYIGSSSALKVRERQHFNLLKRNKHPNKYLQNSFNKYGQNSLNFFIIEICNCSSLKEREQYYLNLYKCFAPNDGFNLCKSSETTLGRPVSEETRKKLSISCSGFKHTEEAKKKISDKNKGYKRAREVTDKILKSKKGFKHSEETKRKISIKALGRKVSKETIRKMLETKKRKAMENFKSNVI